MQVSCEPIPSHNSRLLYISLFFLIFFSFSVIAQPATPFTQIIQEKVDIQFPLIRLIEQNKNFTFNFHIFNSTNGIIFDNTTHECRFHLFDNQGIHIVNNLQVPFEIIGKDFEITISGGNFSRIGEYSFLVICNSTTGGGSVSVMFDVTENGLELPIEANTRLNSFYLILAVAVIFLIVGLAKEDPTFLNLSGIAFVITGVFIAVNGFVGLNNLMTDLLLLVLWGAGFYIIYKTNIELLD